MTPSKRPRVPGAAFPIALAATIAAASTVQRWCKTYLPTGLRCRCHAPRPNNPDWANASRGSTSNLAILSSSAPRTGCDTPASTFPRVVFCMPPPAAASASPPWIRATGSGDGGKHAGCSPRRTSPLALQRSRPPRLPPLHDADGKRHGAAAPRNSPCCRGTFFPDKRIISSVSGNFALACRCRFRPWHSAFQGQPDALNVCSD